MANKINRFDNAKLINKIFETLRVQDIVFTFFYYQDIELETPDSMRDYKFTDEIIIKLYDYMANSLYISDDDDYDLIEDFILFMEDNFGSVLEL
jgi:hypothetical protein